MSNHSSKKSLDSRRVDPADFKPIDILGRGSFAEVYLVRKVDNQ